MPNHDVAPFSVSWLSRSSTLPICSQFTKSLEWKMGTPGKYWNVEFTR